MCIFSGINKQQRYNLFLFILPQVLICGYLVFVLHVTHLGTQMKMFPQYFQQENFDLDVDDDDDEYISQPDAKSDSLSNFLFEEDTRFDQDEKDDFQNSKIAEIDMQEVDSEGKKLLDFQKFYHEFLSYNMPVVLRKASIHWKAYTKWQTDEYLVSKFGDKEVQVEVRDDGENKFAYFSKNFKQNTMLYKEFIDVYKDPNRKANYYWAENNIPEEIVDDIIEPEIGIFMNLEYTKMWQGASGTESLPHTDDKDNFLCQISGKKTIVLIAPTQRSKLYVGIGKKEIYNYSQVDFFNPDLKKHPLFAEVKGKMKVEINPGDILFIPSFWWHHVKSSKERNIAVNFWYTPNYMHSLQQAAFESGNSK